MTIDEAIKALSSVNLGSMAYDVLKDNEKLLADSNRLQLLDGLGRDGNYLSPLYSQDPYFKQPGAALRYAVWKSKKSKSNTKPDMVADLYVNGKFHKSITATAVGNGAYFQSNDDNAPAIEGKFRTALGINEETIDNLRSETLNPQLAELFSQKTGFKIK